MPRVHAANACLFRDFWRRTADPSQPALMGLVLSARPARARLLGLVGQVGPNAATQAP